MLTFDFVIMSDRIPLPTVDLFTSELESVGPKWYDFGIFLGIATPQLDHIEKYHGSEGTQRCLIELFKCFQSHIKPVSWNDVVDALTKMCYNNLAGCIREKYIQTVSSSNPSSAPPNTKNEREARESDSQGMVSETLYLGEIISKFDEISKNFTSLVLEVRQALQRKPSIIDQLQVALKDQCGLKPLPTKKATPENIFDRMDKHYCFLNYHILAYLLDKFLSNEEHLQQLLVNYTNKLEKFKESVMMKDLMKLIKEKRDLCGNNKIVEMKTCDYWGAVTLNKFDRLAKQVFRNLYKCAAQIRIEDGCICISWVIPDIDTSVLVTVSPEFLKAVGVISLKIDDMVLYERPNEGCHILESAFLQAVELGNIRAVELLLAVGCDISIHKHTGELAITSAMKLRDGEGLGIFHLACISGHTDVVHMLLEPGNSDQQIFDQVAAELHFVDLTWHDVGVFFDITTSELAHIEQNHGSKGTQRCLIELFKCFQSRSKPVSWNNIADVFTNIHNNDFADSIRQTTSSIPKVEPDVSHKALALPTVDLFVSELESVGPRWYDLGIFLGISTHELNDIEKHSQSKGNQRCFIELFKCFQFRTKPVSWNDISDALTKIHNNYLADEIRDKYIWTVSSLPQHYEQIGSASAAMETSRVDVDLYIDNRISREFREIITTFAALVLDIRRVLQKQSVSIQDIQVFVQECCGQLPLSTEEATLERVFTRMRQHYCFLNYHILADLVDKFLSNEKCLVQLLVNYTNKLEKFKESVKVKDLMMLIKEKRDLCGNHKIIQLKTRNFWGKFTLHKFEKLAKLIFQNLYDCAAQIRIEDGCICVSWVIPDIDTSVLVTVSPDLLKVVGVISLKIEDKVLYEGPNEESHILESAFVQAVEFLAVGCDNIYAHTSEVAINSVMKLRDSERMPIHTHVFYLACLNGHTDVLLEAGNSPHARSINGWTPLAIASGKHYNHSSDIAYQPVTALN